MVGRETSTHNLLCAHGSPFLCLLPVLRSASETPVPTMQGHLVKEPRRGHLLSQRRRRFFVLRGHELIWYSSEDRSYHKGTLQLEGAKVEHDGNFLTVASSNERVVLSGDALDEWERAIRAAITPPQPPPQPPSAPPLPPPLRNEPAAAQASGPPLPSPSPTTQLPPLSAAAVAGASEGGRTEPEGARLVPQLATTGAAGKPETPLALPSTHHTPINASY